MPIYYEYKTKPGTFRIEQTRLGWIPMFESEALAGAYRTAQSALDGLVEGLTDWPSCGNPAELDLPNDFDDWERING